VNRMVTFSWLLARLDISTWLPSAGFWATMNSSTCLQATSSHNKYCPVIACSVHDTEMQVLLLLQALCRLQTDVSEVRQLM
jgi:hypothetical protein